MSNYLIHMTDKKSLYNILEEGGSVNCGLIKSYIPKGANSESFEHKITCFTESPIYALGAFMKISSRRKSEQMQFGIGFKKNFMVNKGVRPTIYIDWPTLTNLLSLKNSEKMQDKNKVSDLLDHLSSLAHPLGENYQRQGFSWEREWRFVNEIGFEFNYDDIGLICCPESEKAILKVILGDFASDIVFIDTSHKYNVHSQLIIHSEEMDKIKNGLDLLEDEEIDGFLEDFDEYIEQLNEYKEYLVSLTEDISSLEKQIEEFKEWRVDIKANTAEYCGHYSQTLINHHLFGTVCPNCYDGLQYAYEKFVQED
nr:hypothetical protein [Aliivibrio wodanis]